MRTATFTIFLAIILIASAIVGLFTYLDYEPLRQDTTKANSEKQTTIPTTPPPLPVRPIIASTDPIRGNPNAPLAIVEFGDFFCAPCQSMQPALENLLKQYDNQIKLVWKDFPNLTIHPLAKKAAQAARCAEEQNKFWEYHDLLFQRQAQLTETNFITIASDLNLDTDSFGKCINAQSTKTLVESSFNQGLLLNVDGTPYFFINEQRVSGAATEAELQNIINTALGI